MLTRAALVIAALLSAAAPARAGILYAATTTNLVTIDPADPSQVTVVGALGLGGVQVRYLAYHPGDGFLYGTSNFAGSQPLFRIDRATGAGTVVADLGTGAGVGFIESLEYVHALGSLVISRGTPADDLMSSDIFRITTAGAAALQTQTPGRDNDASVYDSLRNRYYTADSNGPQQLVLINTTDGTGTDSGPVPFNSGDMAYSTDEDAIYVRGGVNEIHRGITLNGGATWSFGGAMAVGGDPIFGLAFVPTPVPEPAAVLGAALVFGAAFLRLRRAAEVSRSA